MIDPDCERWIAIADAAVLGEPVSAAEREFERAHQAMCPRCQQEASVWARLRPSRLQAVPNAEDVDEIVNLARKQHSPAPTRRFTPRPLALAAGAVAVAAAAGLVSWLQPGGSGAERASLALRSGGTLEPAQVLAAGQYAADTCVEVAGGVTLCVAAGSELSRVELAPPQRSVTLARGRVVASLAAQPAGTSFGLVTKEGSVMAASAIVSVETGLSGQSTARVHHGAATVRTNGSATDTSLVEGQALRLGARQVEPVSAAERERDRHLLERPVARLP